MSGMYVRVNLPLAGILDAFAVPQKALTRGKTDTVMVVNAQGGVEPRTVKVGGQKAMRGLLPKAYRQATVWW